MNRWIISIVIGIFLTFPRTASGYDIKIKIKGLANQEVILGHHFNKAMYPDDTLVTDAKGNGRFFSDTLLPGGLYFIYIPSKSGMVDFLLDENQVFTLTSDTTDLNANVKAENSPLNTRFFEYQRFLIQKQKEAKEMSDQLKAASSEVAKQPYKKSLQLLNDEVENYQLNLINENRDNFLSGFLLATREIEVPDPPKDAQGNILDSLFQYRYFRSHYFDNFDLSDIKLLHTPFYEDKLMNYLDNVIPQSNDTIISEIDKIIEKSKSNPELFRYVLITLFNKYAQSKFMGQDAIYIHIADAYYIKEAYWSDTTFIEDLKERVRINKPLLIGKTAPNVELVLIENEHFIMAAEDTAMKKNPYVGNLIKLHDFSSPYTLLVFWAYDCGHCKKEIPQLHDMYESDLKDMGVKIVAVNTIGGVEGKENWTNFINEYQLYDWYNCWNPYDFKYKTIYDITSTPRIFLLDKNKKIIGKRIGVDQVLEIVKHEINSNK